MAPLQPLCLYDDADPARWIGRPVGTSSWHTIDQEMINGFGRVTKDWDKMHVDPEWCHAHSPLGTPISFGFLTVSLLTVMLNECHIRPHDEVATFNYGFNRLRIVSPVRVGKRVRGHFTLQDIAARKACRYQATYAVTVEIEGEDKPALVAEWLLVTDTAKPRAKLDARIAA